MIESIFAQLRNQEFYSLLLLRNVQQNNNDYLHRIKYEKFSYRFMNTDNVRKEYCKNFMVLQKT